MTSRALVTGASRGIGKAASVALAGAGFDVALAARTLRVSDPTHEHSTSVHHRDRRPLPGSIEETAGLVEAVGQKALALRLDLTDLDSVESAMDLLIDEWGGVDVVVNNGRHIGPGHWDSILDTPIEHYLLYVMALGVAPIRMAQRLLPGCSSEVEGRSSRSAPVWPSTFTRPAVGPASGTASARPPATPSSGAFSPSTAIRGSGASISTPEQCSPSVTPSTPITSAHTSPGRLLQQSAQRSPGLSRLPRRTTSSRGDIDARALVIQRQLYPNWRPALT